MKIIDLLNKIANGDEVPKKIHIKNFQSDFIFNGYTYLSDDKEPQNIYWCLHSGALNYEVEIIKEDKEIEKLEQIITKRGKYKFIDELAIDVSKAFETIDDLIINQNKLIDKVNSLENKQ